MLGKSREDFPEFQSTCLCGSVLILTHDANIKATQARYVFWSQRYLPAEPLKPGSVINHCRGRVGES